MFKQQSPRGEQTTYLVPDKLTGVKANLQGQHVLPLFNSLKAGMGLSGTFCTGHGIPKKANLITCGLRHLFPVCLFSDGIK